MADRIERLQVALEGPLTRLVVLAVAWLGFLASLGLFLLTYYESVKPQLFNSDTLYLPSLYRDITVGADLSQWKFPPATYLFPDGILYFAVHRLSGNVRLAMPFFGIVQTLLFTVGLLVLGKVLIKGFHFLHHALIVSMGTLFWLSAGGFEMHTLGLLVPSLHAGVILVLPFVFGLTLSLLQGAFHSLPWRCAAAVTLFAVSTLMIASDLFFVWQVVIPLAAVAILLNRLGNVNRRWVCLVLVLLGLSVACGFMIDSILHARYPVLERYLAPSYARDAFRYLVYNLADLGKIRPIQAALSVAVVVICSWVTATRFAPKAWNINRNLDSAFPFAAFMCCLIVVNLGTVILSGAYPFDNGFRYILPLLILPAFWGIPFSLPILHSSTLAVRALMLLVVVVVSTGALLLGVSNASRFSGLEAISAYYPPAIACLDGKARALGLKYGIATYWQARHLTELSTEGLRIVQVQANLAPYHWINNLAWYNIEPQFIVINDGLPMNDGYRINEDLVRNRFGDPATTFTCGTSKVLVYDREGDVTFRAIFKAVSP